MSLAAGLSIGLAGAGVAPGGGGAAPVWAPAQVVPFSGSSLATITVTLPQATVAGNWIAVFLSMQSGGGTSIPTSLADSASNTYANATSRDSNGVPPVLFVGSTSGNAPASATTVTITWSGAISFEGLIVEGKGAGAVGFKGASTATSSSANSLSASVTTTNTTEVVFGAMSNANTTPASRTTGYQPWTMAQSGGVLDVAYKQVSPGVQTYQAAYYGAFASTWALAACRFLTSF